MRHACTGLRLAALASLFLALTACGGSSRHDDTTVVGSQVEGITVTSITPAVGALEGGTPIQIDGTGFLAVSPATRILLRIGDRVVQGNIASGTRVDATTPAGGAPGPVNITVVIDERAGSLDDAFTYDPAAPTAALSPTSGSFDANTGGTRIDVQLANLPAVLAAPTVTVGGVAAGNVQVTGPDSLSFQVPMLGATGTQVVEIVDGATTVTANLSYLPAPNANDLIINEFFPSPGTVDANRDGVVDTTGDEYVEIVNRGASAVDLSGMQIADGVSVRHVFPNPTVIPAGGAIVVFGFGNPMGFAGPGESGQAQVASDGSLGLNNSSDTITLFATDGTTVLFEVSYTSNEVDAGRAMNNATDGGALASPATAGTTFVFHDTLVVAPASPGTRADGSPF